MSRDIGTSNEASLEIKAWFSGDCFRNDVSDGDRETSCSFCEDQYIVDYGDGEGFLTSLATDYDDPYTFFSMLHPRWMGLEADIGSGPQSPGNSGLFSSYNSEKLATFSETEVDLGGTTCVLMSLVESSRIPSRIPSGYDTKEADPDWKRFSEQFPDVKFWEVRTSEQFWFAIDMGYSLVRFVRSRGRTDDSEQSIEQLDVDIQQHQDVWYPKRVVFKAAAGGELVKSWTVDVLDVSFDDVEDGAFELRGRLPQEGVRLRRNVGSKLEAGAWHNGKAVYESNAPPPLPSQGASVEGRSWLRWFFLVNGIALLVFAAVFVYRSRH